MGSHDHRFGESRVRDASSSEASVRVARARRPARAAAGVLVACVVAVLFVVLFLTRRTSESSAGESSGAATDSAKALRTAPMAKSLVDGDTLGQPEVLQRLEVEPPAAREANETLLRVHVRTPTGEAVTNGVLELEETLSLALDGPWGRVVRRTPIAGVTTELKLGAEVFEARLVASSPGLNSGTARLEQLRLRDDAYAPTGRIVRDVEVVLGAAPPTPWIGGRIRVDGRDEVPAGLRIEATFEDGRRIDDVETCIDVANASYWIGPLPRGKLALLATSDSTAPKWVDAPDVADRSSARCDLDLAAGVVVELHAIDAQSGESAPGACLFIDLSIRTWSRSGRQGFGGRTQRLVADSDGRCTLRGVARPGVLTVTTCPRAREGAQGYVFEPGPTLLVVDLETTKGDVLAFDVPIGALEPEHVVLWGRWPEGDGFSEGGGELAIAGQWAGDGRAARVVGRRTASGGWELEAPAPSQVRVWVERERRRVSEVLAFDAPDARPIGPLRFTPVRSDEVLLRWSGGRTGERCTVRASADGVVERVAEFSIDEAVGEHALQLLGPCSLLIAAIHADGGVDQRSIEIDPAAQRVIDVDWRGEAQVELRAQVDGRELESDADVVLVRLGADAESADAQLVRLRSGRASIPALPVGDYFFRIEAALDDGPACGVMTVASALSTALSTAQLECRTEVVEIAPPARGALLERIGAVDLTGRVPARLLHVHLGDPDPNAAAEGPRRLRLPRDSRWSVFP